MERVMVSKSALPEGGLGKVHQVFGEGLNEILEEMNAVLAA